MYEHSITVGSLQVKQGQFVMFSIEGEDSHSEVD